MMSDSKFANGTDSTPTSLAVESKNNTQLRVFNDTTDIQGVRQVKKKKITCDDFWTKYELTDGVASIWSLEQIRNVLPSATKRQAMEVLKEMKARVGGSPKDQQYSDADEGFCDDDVRNSFDELFGDAE
jgi:hypothetical protein